MQTQATEPEVTVESLQSSLDDLVKAADATDLVKASGGGDANRVEHSGHQDEDGKKGGGRGSMSDAGGLDNMMIGKLAELGFTADQIAAMDAGLTGKMKGKQEGEDEGDDDEDEEGMEGAKKGGAHAEGAEPLVKSMEEFRQDPDIAAAIDVSPYLEAVTARTAEQIDRMNAQLAKSAGNQAVVNRAMAGALHQMGSLMKDQSAVIDELGKRLGFVERQPQPQKGVTSAAALQKGMPGEAGAGGEVRLTKSEVLSTLSYMNLEKSIKVIDGQPTSQAIGLLEGGGVTSPGVIDAVRQFHVQNPNESEVARQYR